ncbi:E3 SUMO protein ligase SIZ1-like proteon [Haematococcus lacustris]|uniref:E3 SUMO protein ligase SIZ1-like proteon n=1 Tax=Haematococcus lacustris TaxID=44745 RepID=A0A699ZS74_HAELA|nr:E3 SUMO protein ligase SIZ1-like proteon [Haematococcus lacustris]
MLMRNSCVQQLQIDSYVAAVLAGLANRPDVSEVDIAPDGTWRPAAPGSKQPPERWYSPGEAALSAAEVAAQRGAVPQVAPGSEAGPLIKPEPEAHV